MGTLGDLRAGGTVAIVGAGPAGLALARLLQAEGFSVRILERDASATARPQGGSLDLRPSSGQRTIRKAGLEQAFARVSRSEAKAFKMLDPDGRVQPGAGDETHEDAGPEVDRGDLRQLLIDAVAPGTISWGHRVEDVRPEADGRWRLAVEGREPVVAELVVGADGAGSRVRRRLSPARPRYTGITMLAANIREDLWRGSGIAELLGEGSMMFAGGERTIFVQRCARDVILLYYSLRVAEDWPKAEGFGLDDTGAVMAAVRKAYRDWSPEVLAMLTQVRDGFQRWPISVMPPDNVWETKSGLTMLGDAAHVMPPFTGKGVNLALLDALELAKGLTADLGRDVTEVVGAFEAGMQARTRKEIGECLGVGRQIYGLEMDFGRAGAA